MLFRSPLYQLKRIARRGLMPRKVVSTYLPPNLRDLFELVVSRLGLSESEVLRMMILEYLDNHNIIREYLQKGKIAVSKNGSSS